MSQGLCVCISTGKLNCDQVLTPFAYASFPSSEAASERCIPAPVLLPSLPRHLRLPCSRLCSPPEPVPTVPTPEAWSSSCGAGRRWGALPWRERELRDGSAHTPTPLGPSRGEQLDKAEPQGKDWGTDQCCSTFSGSASVFTGTAALYFIAVLKALAH